MFRDRGLRKKLKRLATDGVDDETVVLLTTGDSKQKFEIANAVWGAAADLSDDDRARIVPALRSAANDASGETRANALSALLALDAADAVDRGRAALSDPDWSVRMLVAAALGHQGDPSSGPFLLALLKDPEPFVRAQAAGALQNLGFIDAVPALEEMLATEKDSHAKEMAAEALAALDTTRQ